MTAAQAAGGGTVFFPSGTYKVTGTGGGAISLGDKVRLLGVGRGSTVKSAENPSSDVRLFRVTDAASVVVESLRVLGPDNYGAGGQVIAIQASSGAVRIRAQDVLFSRLTYAVKAWDSSTTSIEFFACEVDGAGLGASGGATAILHPGAPGAEVVVHDSFFHDLGDRARPGQVHALYLYHPVSCLISASRFDGHEDGRYVQFFGGTGNAEYALIDGCRFGRMATPNVACQTNPTVETVISDCFFEVDRKAITMKGSCVISSCRFAGDDAGNYWQIEQSGGTNAAAVIADCYFTGNNVQDVRLSTSATWEVLIRDCVFDSNSTVHVGIEQGAANQSVSIAGCLFAGTSAGGDAIDAAGGNVVSIVGNRFRNANRAIDTGASSAPSTLYFAQNDFSQVGQSVRLQATPTSWRGEDNYGSVGYKTRNGGTASKADLETISHGLGASGAPITPTKFGVTPQIARRIAAISAVNNTTMTLRLHDDAGTAIAVAENVTWWAEQ